MPPGLGVALDTALSSLALWQQRLDAVLAYENGLRVVYAPLIGSKLNESHCISNFHAKYLGKCKLK